MSNGEASIEEEFNRMLDGFSALIEGQQRELGRGMREISRALERAVERFSDTLANAPAPSRAGGGERAEGAAGPPAASAGGVMLVRIVNTDGEAVPTRQVADRSFGGIFGGILGGVGSFLGNLVGGIAGGFMSPIMTVVFAAEVIAFMVQLKNLVAQIRDLAGFLIGGLAWFLRELFGQLYEAGVFPVSRLIASLLLLIDYGLTIVLRHLRPFLEWARGVIETLTQWLGRFISRLGSWMERLLERLAVFLGDLVDYLLDRVVRELLELAMGAAGTLFSVLQLAGEHIAHALKSAWNDIIDGLMSALFGFLGAVGSTFGAVAEHLRFAINSVINGLLSRLHLPTLSNPPPSQGIGAAARSGWRSGVAEGRRRAAGMHLPTTAPSETFAEAARRGFTTGQTAARVLGNLIMGRVAEPEIDVPGFGAPRLELPETPEVSPQLRRLLGEEEARRRAAEAQGGEAGGVTVQGDVNVEVRAETLDLEHSEQVARSLAEQMMEELRRLSRQERFGRGLA